MASEWSRDRCAGLNLGDTRRTAIVRGGLDAMVKSPAGTVTGVFDKAAEREAMYRFLESKHTRFEPLRRAFGLATARQASDAPFVYVAVDGSSLSLADHERTKFGAIGATSEGGRGMKVITAYAVDAASIPLGVLFQHFWARETRTKSAHDKRRPPRERETMHWCTVIQAAKDTLRAEAPETKPWFVIDREGDSFFLLKELEHDCHFTIRANANRRVEAGRTQRRYVGDVLRENLPRAIRYLDVPATKKRAARRAGLLVSTATVTLRLRDKWSKKVVLREVNVVELRETLTPRGQKPIVWRLYTDHDVSTDEGIDRVVESYRARWRVEEFHRTWKTGACNVESSQLRSQKALLIWATMQAASASRIEHLKQLSREKPETPPEEELSAAELKALWLLHNKRKKRNEVMPDRILTLGQAMLWIAELGGYTGKSSGGPPGATTIRRGLEVLRVAAQMLEILEQAKSSG